MSEEQTKDQGIFRQILECSISAKEDFEQIAKREAELLQIDRERQEKPDGPSPRP